jgi:F-type H+-transporting ATPase subunit a
MTESTTAELYAAAADSAHVADSEYWVLSYIKDAPYVEFKPFGKIPLPQFEPVEIFGLSVNLSPTKYVFYMWMVALLLLILMFFVARSYKKSLVPGGFANFIEVLIIFIRDDIAFPNIGPQAKRYLPYLLTTFFFIMTCNLIGLVPWGVSSTENINVTAGLALVAFFMIQIAGIQENGALGYFKGLVPHGLPFWLLPVMVVVELLGLLTKPFALTIRLFANMTSGKIVILSLIGLIFIFQSYIASVIPVVFTLFIMLLKLFISVLQAYIFTMLTALFIGMAVHQEH